MIAGRALVATLLLHHLLAMPCFRPPRWLSLSLSVFMLVCLSLSLHMMLSRKHNIIRNHTHFQTQILCYIYFHIFVLLLSVLCLPTLDSFFVLLCVIVLRSVQLLKRMHTGMICPARLTRPIFFRPPSRLVKLDEAFHKLKTVDERKTTLTGQAKVSSVLHHHVGMVRGHLQYWMRCHILIQERMVKDRTTNENMLV